LDADAVMTRKSPPGAAADVGVAVAGLVT